MRLIEIDSSIAGIGVTRRDGIFGGQPPADGYVLARNVSDPNYDVQVRVEVSLSEAGLRSLPRQDRSRREGDGVHYPVNERAAAYGASVTAPTDSPAEAYADWPNEFTPTQLEWPLPASAG